MTISAPLWLLLALLVPVVRWIHRWRRPVRRQVVPAVFLWSGKQTDQEPGNVRQNPDPAWRRRALVVLLLAVYLAAPGWNESASRVTVWVDQSLSMQTIEDGRTRLETGLERLTALLADVSGPVLLRSLGNPAFVREYADTSVIDFDAWNTQTDAPVQGLPTSLLDPGSSHWLLTDGASEVVRDWAGRAGLARIVSVGRESENAAVTLLAARRSDDGRNGIDIMATVANTGAEVQERRLRLLAGDRVLDESTVLVPGGQVIHVRSHSDIWPPEVRAVLEPGDGLSADDRLLLSLAAISRLGTFVAAECPESLRRAVASHPALVDEVTAGQAVLSVDCPRAGDAPPAGAGPRIIAWSGPAGPVTGRVAWTTEAGSSIALDADWLEATAWSPPIDIDRVEPLIVAGERVLAAAKEAAGGGLAVETVLDLGAARFARRPEFALVFAALVDHVTGRQLLDEYLSQGRDIAASRIAPARFDAGEPDTPRFGTSVRPLSAVFLVLAMLVLLYDLVRSLSRGRQNDHA